MASDPETDDLPVSNSSKGYATSGKIMLSAIVTLFAVIIFMLCLHLYARCFIYRRRRRRRLLRQTHLVFYMEPANSADASRGLDAAVLESLPVFVYDSKTHPEIPECAVCLSEFDANEKGRVLPKCNHSFHIECIDMWLCSHSTCPLCRSPIEPEPPLEIVVEPEPSRTVPTGEEGALPENSSSFRTTSSWERRKPLGLSLETEPGSTESPVSQAFKSPGVRGLSLTRIMNRRGLSFSGPVSESELGVEEGSERTRTLTPR